MQRTRLNRYAAFLVIAVALLFYLPGLGISVVEREQELRVALTARSMAEGGSWLEPNYLGQLRLRKPPLMYWAVALSYRIGGATDHAWLARLPSALAGVGLAFIVYLAGRQFFGKRRAGWAAIACATSLIILRQARLSETDVLLTFWVTLAVWSGFRALFESAGWRWMVLAGISSGLGFMTKGPAALVLPVFAWAAFAFTRPSHRLRVGPTTAKFLLWFALALALAVPWYGYLAARAGSLAQLQQELSATFGETTQHPGPWYYYLYTFFVAFAPWSLALPIAFKKSWRGARRNGAMRFILGWFITTLLALSFTSSKQIHYCTLLVPPASLLVGWYFGFAFRRRNTIAKFSARWAVPALFIFWLIHIALACEILPNREPKQALQDALHQSASEIHEANRVFLVGRHRATIEFYGGRPILDMDSVKEAWRQSRTGDLIVLNTKEELHPVPPGPVDILAETERRGLYCAVWKKR